MVDDLVVLDVQLHEERLVEQAALLVVTAAIELLGVGHQVQAGIDQPRLPCKFVITAIEPFLEVHTVALDVVELLLDPCAGDVAIRRELDQVGFLDVESMQFSGELLLEEPCGGILVCQGRGDVLANGCCELGRESDGCVVVFNGTFDAGSLRVWGVAGGLLLASAEEVEVLGSA